MMLLMYDLVSVRLVEEADYQHTTELFGGQKSTGGRTLEDFIPKSEDDFLEYAELLAQKIRPFEVGQRRSAVGLALTRFSSKSEDLFSLKAQCKSTPICKRKALAS